MPLDKIAPNLKRELRPVATIYNEELQKIYEETPIPCSKSSEQINWETRNRISSLPDALQQFIESDNILNFDNLENKTSPDGSKSRSLQVVIRSLQFKLTRTYMSNCSLMTFQYLFLLGSEIATVNYLE